MQVKRLVTGSSVTSWFVFAPYVDPGMLKGSGDSGVPVGDQVTVPTQHSLRANQQPQVSQHVAGQPVEKSSQPRSIGPREPGLLAVQLPLQDGELVAQREDLGVLVPVAHRQQPQERESYAEVGQSKQHNRHTRAAFSVDHPPRPGRAGSRLQVSSDLSGQEGRDQDGRGFRHPHGHQMARAGSGTRRLTRHSGQTGAAGNDFLN
ncbi:hypothetical protein [Plantactinospora sp. CA-290183]|uniref:hypothetical protein n=1 Tax=Plantactinospora sp. CA-290183 TaxID=3240006 RepID=UPI003D94F7F5